MSQQSPQPGSLEAAIAEARAVTREQLQAAWQLHVDRVVEQLQLGWREQIDSVVEQRFAELGSWLGSSADAAVRTRVETETTSRVRDLTSRLNQTARRLRNAGPAPEWVRALMDGAVSFCARAALFRVSGRTLVFEGASGWYDEKAAEQVRSAPIALEAAPAFAAAVDSKDVTVTLGAPGQISPAVSAFFAGAEMRKVYLFPLAVREPGEVAVVDEDSPAALPPGRVNAVLFADPGAGTVDANALEMLASLAAATLEARQRVAARPKDLVDLRPASATLPATPEDDALDLQARRYARTFAAELLLNRFGDVKKGRAERDIYGTLKEEIESGRYAFRERFLTARPILADHLHHELVRTLAAGDEALLGPAYPGPLA